MAASHQLGTVPLFKDLNKKALDRLERVVRDRTFKAGETIVTQGDEPLLITSSGFPPTITVHDADSGKVRTEVSEPGVGFSLFFTP